jgi:hypothetical protein
MHAVWICSLAVPREPAGTGIHKPNKQTCMLHAEENQYPNKLLCYSTYACKGRSCTWGSILRAQEKPCVSWFVSVSKQQLMHISSEYITAAAAHLPARYPAYINQPTPPSAGGEKKERRERRQATAIPCQAYTPRRKPKHLRRTPSPVKATPKRMAAAQEGVFLPSSILYGESTVLAWSTIHASSFPLGCKVWCREPLLLVETPLCEG